MIQQECYRIYNKGLRDRVIKRPDTCANCDRLCKVAGHHIDYNKPLTVEWLCHRCHGEADSRRNQRIWNERMDKLDSTLLPDELDEIMFTAEQIAERTDIKIHTVRYRLSELRREGKVKSQQFGTTYVYPPSVVDKVKDYSGKE